MNKVRFISFGMLLIVGMTTVVFSSCSKGDDDEEGKPDPSITDSGVIINGVKWATRNVAAPGTFAVNPEDAGMFYQWDFKMAFPATGTVSLWPQSYSTRNTWEKFNDPSPDGWHIPTLEECIKLRDKEKVTTEWTTLNGVNGRRFADIATGHSIFLPATGWRGGWYGMIYLPGEVGSYWFIPSEEMFEFVSPEQSFVLESSISGAELYIWMRNNASSIRCVAD